MQWQQKAPLHHIPFAALSDCKAQMPIALAVISDGSHLSLQVVLLLPPPWLYPFLQQQPPLKLLQPLHLKEVVLPRLQFLEKLLHD